ncbi:SigE family RNA polymerase sigma factor [Frankia sp. AgPm24]|uniref:SigE family RNA polymerase sigma factor n=1 Tax=Frankia sp. AgPm24 TaxID=631128 RepID=UPI00200E3095|nr:SigE family RNA polymerase sigma factor [Frankia sp. AgPm24]MCK9923824.1 SigE family RNA polymerase sigma factor [Frankia sp. AgPm24]
MRDDEERAFEEFVERTAQRLLRCAVLLTGDRGAAEDLLQGALERTYRHWHRIGAQAPEAYIRRALVNAATSRWRRRRFHEVPLLTDDAWTADARIADHAEVLSQRDGLIRALQALPPRQRAVIVLRYLDDLPEAEVATALGCSVGSVKSHASRGLARLRESTHLSLPPDDDAAAQADPAADPGASRKASGRAVTSSHSRVTAVGGDHPTAATRSIR